MEGLLAGVVFAVLLRQLLLPAWVRARRHRAPR